MTRNLIVDNLELIALYSDTEHLRAALEQISREDFVATLEAVISRLYTKDCKISTIRFLCDLSGTLRFEQIMPGVTCLYRVSPTHKPRS